MAKNTDLTLFEELLKESAEIKYPKEGDVITGNIIKIEKKNILVNINNQFTGLVVNKELGNSVDLLALNEGDVIEVMVLGDSIERGLLILSLKRANQIKSLSNLGKYFNTGEVITVRPTEANKGGLLVDIDGLKGFIPVSQLTPIHYPRVEGANQEKILAHLNGLVGKDFKVKVINVSDEGKKIIFSEKAAIEEKREKALLGLKEGDIVEGVVSGILTYGLFVTFDGLEGLVHVSEIDWGHVNNPSKFAKVGQKVKVKIIGLDTEKISLSIKRLRENPWDILASKYKVGDIIKAPISRISQFGAFIELDGGIQGLIHLSEISNGIVKDIREHIKVGQEVDVKIINFDPAQKRIGLSIKALLEPVEGDEKKENKPKQPKETKVKEKKETKEEVKTEEIEAKEANK
ncbi:MAG: S1 RNA-binding domain-containing protein [Candidatus Gracilibacteria bacterium]|nr:S1 RNA-binding domain-containing protein [Candidatus Gracilibacteria bacterium]